MKLSAVREFLIAFLRGKGICLIEETVVRINGSRIKDMVASNLERIIRACAEDFGVESVWLFGSALKDYRRDANSGDTILNSISISEFLIIHCGSSHPASFENFAAASSRKKAYTNTL